MKHVRPFRVLGATAALSVVAVGAIAAPGGAPEIDLASESGTAEIQAVEAADDTAAPVVREAVAGEEFPGDGQVAADEVSAPSAPSEPSEPSVQSVSEPSEPSVPSEPSQESVSEPSAPSEPSPESVSEPSIESVSDPSADEDDDLD